MKLDWLHNNVAPLLHCGWYHAMRNTMAEWIVLELRGVEQRRRRQPFRGIVGWMNGMRWGKNGVHSVNRKEGRLIEEAIRIRMLWGFAALSTTGGISPDIILLKNVVNCSPHLFCWLRPSGSSSWSDIWFWNHCYLGFCCPDKQKDGIIALSLFCYLNRNPAHHSYLCLQGLT